ncbi:MAG: YqaJ viral recombinase family protein [Bacillota bacterium]
MKIDTQQKIIILPEPPGRVKKITGTRFAAILGLNPWSSPFEAWCDMTGVYKIPFEENQYTAAGKAIEPIVISYLDKRYYFGKGLLQGPEAWFKKTKDQMRYDHFPEQPIFGGMWDARTKTAVYELKTSKRVEDWYKRGVFCPPEYYKLQGALYAYLMGLDEFRLVLTILEDKDYANPAAFVPTPENTIVKKFSLAAEFPEFAAKLDACLAWCDRHIAGAVSPEWDPAKKNDVEIMKALTTAHVPMSKGEDIVAELIRRIEPLQARIEAVSSDIAEDEKTLKTLKDQLKSELEGRMKESDKKIQAEGSEYVFEVSRTAPGLDTERLKKDGIYEQYLKTGYGVKININRRKEVS